MEKLEKQWQEESPNRDYVRWLEDRIIQLEEEREDDMFEHKEALERMEL